jgi:hypothetical protein
MDEQIALSERDKIFATGVFLQPCKCTINGIEQWRWVAVGFMDASYYDGEVISIYDFADTLEGLIDNSEHPFQV